MRVAVGEVTLDVPSAFAHLRPFPMDGAVLLFDRDTGLNVLCDGPETAGLKAVAPRVVQFGITNHCNLACTFCSRDLGAESAWSLESAFATLAELAAGGVLEVAFGGGEPFTFKGFSALVRRLHAETPLAVNITTNGVALTRERLAEITGELLIVWGTLDPHIPAEGRRTVEQALTAAGVRYSTREYAAEHAFMRDEGPRYDPAATDQAFAEMISFYRRVFAA